MTEKTWVYWLGLLIVAFSIVSLIGGVSALAFPWTPVKAGPTHFASMATRFAITRLLGSLVFLAVGVYMMMSGRVKK